MASKPPALLTVPASPLLTILASPCKKRLWLRGRYFKDVNSDGHFSPTIDLPFAAVSLKVGRLAGNPPAPMSLGQGTTDASGVFDIFFSGSPTGKYVLFLTSNKQVIATFPWPTNDTSHGLLVPMEPPKTSTATRTRTATKVYRAIGTAWRKGLTLDLRPDRHQNQNLDQSISNQKTNIIDNQDQNINHPNHADYAH